MLYRKIFLLVLVALAATLAGCDIETHYYGDCAELCDGDDDCMRECFRGADRDDDDGPVVVTCPADDPFATPVDINNDGIADGQEDPDGDGITNEVEVAAGTDPLDADDYPGAARDLDMDGLSELDEQRLGCNPNAADTDGDGLLDGQEVLEGTSPLRADTDNDCVDDREELHCGSDPRDPLSVCEGATPCGCGG